MNPIIVINVNMGSKGHQIGRLISTCDNIAWYDHADNGEQPWLSCKNILNAELGRSTSSITIIDNDTSS